MIGVKQIFLWAGWCVLALQFFMKWCPFFLFGSTLYAKYIWSMYPDTACGCIHWCFELQYIVISIRISTTAEKGYILGKPTVRFLFPLLWAIRCPRQETGSDKKRTVGKGMTGQNCARLHWIPYTLDRRQLTLAHQATFLIGRQFRFTWQLTENGWLEIGLYLYLYVGVDQSLAR